jgi:hypothetical protein
MNMEDASKFLISYIRNPTPSGYSNYGYDIYMWRVIDAYLQSQGSTRSDERNKIAELSPQFLAAAWDLCRRGIIRPGVARLGSQSTDEGSAGAGFAITPFGRTWLAESDKDDYVPIEPERFAQLIARHNPRFGPGFAERSQEAIRCYGAHAYLACCVMCGAAAESILLAAAIAKKGNEDEILKTYQSALGRSRVTTFLLGNATTHLKNQFNSYVGLLSYWRDESAHGLAQGFDDEEAFTSMSLLLRFALLIEKHWTEITTT